MKYLIATIEILTLPLIVIIAILIVTTPIKGLLDKLRRADIGKKVLEFGEAELDQGSGTLPQPLEPEVPDETDIEGFRTD